MTEITAKEIKDTIDRSINDVVGDNWFDVMDRVHKGIGDASEILAAAFNDQQLNPDPYEWLDWSEQAGNSWVHWMNGDAVVLKDISSSEYKFLEPCLSLPGHWKVSKPLTGKPSGLRDEAWAVLWVKGNMKNPCCVKDGSIYWPKVTAFTILEP